jgi:L-cysteine S-thiosulfotransferase
MHIKTFLLGSVFLLCASVGTSHSDPVQKQALAVMKASFSAKGQAGMDRLDQDALQAACSKVPHNHALTAAQMREILKAQTATLRTPADGKLLGDWREGEKIAQLGTGKQYSDDPAKASGGNCYACHQISKKEVAYGTIGPSLYNYGKLRGYDAQTLRYTYAKIYNAQAFVPCSNMPRFGHKAILTEQQLKDVTALLLDPQSPVNQ